MQVSLADNFGKAVREIGMYFMANQPTPTQFGIDVTTPNVVSNPGIFSTVPYGPSTTNPTPSVLNPQDSYLIRKHTPTTTHLTDANGWTRVAGCFQVSPNDPPREFILVGNFNQENAMTLADLPGTITHGIGDAGFWAPDNGVEEDNSAVYYVSNVLLHEFPTAAGPYTVACGGSVLLGDGCDLPTSSQATYFWERFDATNSNWVPVTLNPINTAFITLGPGFYPLIGGQYRLTVTVPEVDGSGTYVRTTECLVTLQGTPYALTITPSGPLTFCQGGSVTLTASGAVNNSYQWNTGATTASITVTQSGTYTVSGGNADPCAIPASVTVTVNSTPVVTITPNPATLCPGGTVTLTASGANSYVWSTGATTASITVTAVIDRVDGDLYSVTGFNGPNCTGTASTRVRRFFDFDNDPPIAGNVEWRRNMNVRGTVTVQNGATLTIRDATIRFSDTRQGPALSVAVRPTRIVVQPGGQLIIEENSVLTTLESPNPCGFTSNMWDGITVLGTTSSQAVAANQGKVTIENATIANARIGVLLGNSSYSTARVMGPVNASGGGVLIAGNGTVFSNCHLGVYMSPYQDPVSATVTNLSTFTGCSFEATGPLADPFYNGLGMQFGAHLTRVRGITVKNCLFKGFQVADVTKRGYGIFGSDATYSVVCDSYDQPTETCLAGANRFQDLYIGIYVDNNTEGGEVRAIGNTFTNNQGGIIIAGNNFSRVRGNRFNVGTTSGNQDVRFGFGVQFETSGNGRAEANVFQRHAGSQLRGVTVSQAAQGAIEVYRNKFQTGLDIATYTQYNNASTHIRCNDFLHPVTTGHIAAIANVVNGQSVGALADQGLDCSQLPPINPIDYPNNNFFTPTGPGSVPNLRLLQNSLAFNYRYGLNQTAPSGSSYTVIITSPTPATTLQTVSPEQCPFPINSTLGCQATLLGSRPANTLRGLIATAPTADERAALVIELMERFLSDPTIPAGLDSAIAVLQAENNPRYQTWLNQLLVRAGRYGTNSSRAAGGTNAKRQWSNAATAQRSGLDYFTRVLDLLTPLGDDSTITATIAAYPALRAELVAMAEDSLTWGSQAARSALNQYAGTHYRVWMAEPLDDDAAGARVAAGPTYAPAAGRPAQPEDARLTLIPNPSAGPLTVSYAVPQKSATVELVVYDAWGQIAGRYALAAAATEAELALRLRPGVYTAVLRADGTVLQRQRLLLTTR